MSSRHRAKASEASRPREKTRAEPPSLNGVPPSKLPKPKRERRRSRLSRPSPFSDLKWPRIAQRLKKPALYALIGFGASVALLLGALWLGYGRSKGEDPGAVELSWPEGATLEQGAALLAQAGLVESETAIAMFLRSTGGVGDFVSGPHFIPKASTPWELRKYLSRSTDRPKVRVTIPEGFNRFDIGARLEKQHIASKRAWIAATADPLLLEKAGIEKSGTVGAESAEGYLFPATYDFYKDSDPAELMTRLVKEADKRWDIVVEQRRDGFVALKNSMGWGRREILTLASIIEKETGAVEERPLVASVFLNRLLDPAFQPKRLQSDPTSIYGCIAYPEEAPSCEGFRGKPSPAINQDPKNRYSTYTRAGLPPGPIANPGLKSIEAVLSPAATKYFYFVANGSGGHTFSETLDAHNQAVKKPK